MTIKLFWTDPYLMHCEAKVTSIDGNRIQIDKTVFFAFAGGQASDKGTINGIAVTQAIDAPDITYVLEHAPNFCVGDNVHVSIDEPHRALVRRLHSATHIACHFLEQKTGIKDYLGSNVDSSKGRFDFAYPQSIASLLPELEAHCNTFIAQKHPVIVENHNGTLHWKCQDIEMHCCGTHVKNTSEIGPIKLKRKNIGSGKERIELHLA